MKALNELIAASLTLGVAVSPATPVLAQPTPSRGANAELLAFCNELLASGELSESLNLGNCMSFNLTSEQGFSTQFCHYLRGEDLMEEAGFEDFDDCIRNLPF